MKRSFSSCFIKTVLSCTGFLGTTILWADIPVEEQHFLHRNHLYTQAHGFFSEDDSDGIPIDALPVPNHGEEDSLFEEVSSSDHKPSRHNKSRQKGTARHSDRDKPLAIRIDGHTNNMIRLKNDKPKYPTSSHGSEILAKNDTHTVMWEHINTHADFAHDHISSEYKLTIS